MPSSTAIVTVLAYAFLGAAVKYIDDAYDEGGLDRRGANFLCVVSSLAMGALMAWDPHSRAIFLAMNVGLLLAGKIDVLPFKVGFALSLAIPIAWCLFAGDARLDGRVVALFLACCLADELGNDYVDRHPTRPAIHVLLYYRPAMKAAAVVAAALSWTPLVYVPAFLSFDLAYSVVGRVAQTRVVRA